MKNKILFFPGLLITTLGSILFSFTGGIYLLEKTGRSDIFVGNMLMTSIPLIFASVFFGKLIDTISRKKIIVIGDLLNALLMLGVFYLWNQVDRVYLLYGASFITTVLALMVSLALEAAKPQLFNRDELIHMNSLSSIIESGARILGPTLGGVIFAFYNMKAFILFNAISFLISAITEMFFTFREEARSNSEKKSKGFLLGFRYILNHRDIRGLVLLLIIGNIGLAFITLVPLPYLILTHYGISTNIYGVIMGVSSTGLIFGGICVSRFKVVVSGGLFKKVLWTMTSSTFILMALSILKGVSMAYIIGLIGVAAFMIQLSIPFIDIPLFTYLQSNTPSDLRGRVIGSLISMAKTILPISLIISSKVVDNISPFASILIGAILFLCTLLFFDKLISLEDKKLKLQKIQE